MLSPTCVEVPKSVDHVFTGCKDIVDIWLLIARWWDVVAPYTCSVDSMINWANNTPLSATSRKCFDVVIITSFGVLWNFRNAQIFGSVKPNKSGIFDEIASISFFWISNRRKKCKLNRGVWLQNYALACNL